MALAPMRKVTITAHKALEEELTHNLYCLGSLQIEKHEGDDLPSKILTEEESQRIRDCTLRISQIDFITQFLREYEVLGGGFFSTLVKDKYPLTTSEFCQAESRLDLQKINDDCQELESRLIKSADTISDLRTERDIFHRWRTLDIPVDRIETGARTGLLLGFLPRAEAEFTANQLDDEVPESSLEIVGYYGDRAQILVIYLQGTREQVRPILDEHKFEQVELEKIDKTPSERVDELDGIIDDLEKEREELAEEAKKFDGLEADLVILRDYYENERKRVGATTDYGQTRSTVRIEGWMPAERAERDLPRIKDRFSELHLEVSEPQEEDEPPVHLQNRKVARPFELLTKLYGVPHNREYDPTWITGLTFVIFFGFCIGDVGYGLVLILAFYLMKRFLPLGERVKDLFTVFMWGGAASMVVGVLTASYFGYEPESLPAFLRSAAVFDMLEPIPLLVTCMAIGIVHMLAGTVTEFRDNWRLGQRADALIDQGLILLLFVGSFLAALLVILAGLPTTIIFLVAGIAIAGMIVLLGHNAESLPGKIFGGLYETYNTLIGWFGDTVSYVRLYALGLATFAVGWVINILSGKILGLAPVIGILFMLVLLLIGHTFNVAVNLLGAFVHPLRLEFVEFYSKFYEDMGSEYDPLRIESKRVVISDRG